MKSSRFSDYESDNLTKKPKFYEDGDEHEMLLDISVGVEFVEEESVIIEPEDTSQSQEDKEGGHPEQLNSDPSESFQEPS